jgi:hypothetical protein
VHCQKLVATKTARIFVSPFVSPGQVKIGSFLITWDDRNNYSTRFEGSHLLTADDISEFLQNAILPLGNPCSIR